MKDIVIAVGSILIMLVAAPRAGAVSPKPSMPSGNTPAERTESHVVTLPQARAFANYCRETLAVRKRMLELETELLVQRTEEQPDWAVALAVRREIADLESELERKAREASVHTTTFHPWKECAPEP